MSSNLIARSNFPPGREAARGLPQRRIRMFVWSKLSAAKWMDAWEERFAGNPNLVIEFIKGGKSIRLQLFCLSLIHISEPTRPY